MALARRCTLLIAALALAAVTAGCAAVDAQLDGVAAQYDKPLVWTNLSRSGNGTELAVGYRLPPPPPGQVYVVWALTKDMSKTQKLGVLTEGAANGRLTGNANFRVDGVMISVEDSPNVTRIGQNRGVVDVGLR